VNNGEEVIMNNNNSRLSTNYSTFTQANTQSFDDNTSITYVMMIPTAPPVDEFIFPNKEEHKIDNKSYFDNDDERVYEIGPIDISCRMLTGSRYTLLTTLLQ